MLSDEADAAYQEGRFAACAEAYARLGQEGTRPDRHFVAAAGCAARAEQHDDAFALLGRAIDSGRHDPELLSADGDLAPLHADPRWPTALARARDAESAYVGSINAELYEMYKADQAARRVPYEQIDWSVVSVRDAGHRERAAALIEAGALHVADDYFHAAMIFQHGDAPQDYARANVLASRAVSLAPGHAAARWLVAATHDRHLHSLGEPQIYGTQFRKDDGGRWTLAPIDPAAVSDLDRIAMGAPTLAEAEAMAEALNHQGP
jgi:hypothetical protein